MARHNSRNRLQATVTQEPSTACHDERGISGCNLGTLGKSQCQEGLRPAKMRTVTYNQERTTYEMSETNAMKHSLCYDVEIDQASSEPIRRVNYHLS